jgi:hypothetical protein
MSDYITDPAPLILEAREAAARLELRGDAPELLAKINALLSLHGLHGGQQITLTRLLEQVGDL